MNVCLPVTSRREHHESNLPRDCQLVFFGSCAGVPSGSWEDCGATFRGEGRVRACCCDTFRILFSTRRRTQEDDVTARGRRRLIDEPIHLMRCEICRIMTAASEKNKRHDRMRLPVIARERIRSTRRATFRSKRTIACLHSNPWRDRKTTSPRRQPSPLRTLASVLPQLPETRGTITAREEMLFL